MLQAYSNSSKMMYIESSLCGSISHAPFKGIKTVEYLCYRAVDTKYKYMS